MNYAKIINSVLFIVMLMTLIQLSFAQELSLTYDANGNLVTGDGYYRVYNSLNQLWKIYNGSNQNGTLLEELIYHPTEERVYIKRIYNSSGNVTETVYYISQRLVRVVNQSGTYDFGYVYHNGQLVAQDNPDGTTIYIHGDHLGSSSAVTNESGDAVENTSYSPFGEVVTGGQQIRYSYEGKEQDSVVGEIDFHARMYKPEFGMFTQPDTLIQNIYDPQSLNRYMFERGNPYKIEDVTGHSWVHGHAIGAYFGLRDLGFDKSESIQMAIVSISPDIVPHLDDNEKKEFYDFYGGDYDSYHFDPGNSEDEKEATLEWAARKFIEAYDSGKEYAGIYLHPFGDTMHAGGPPAGHTSTSEEKKAHMALDSKWSNVESTRQNINKYVGHAINLYGKITEQNYKSRGFHKVSGGYQKSWNYNGKIYKRTIYSK